VIDGSPSSCEISLTVRWLWGLSSWFSNSDLLTVSTFSSVHMRLPLPGRMSTVPNFTSSIDKKQTYMKTETCKLYFAVFWIFLPYIIKIDLCNFELCHFKVGPFFETQWCIVAEMSRYSVRIIIRWTEEAGELVTLVVCSITRVLVCLCVWISAGAVTEKREVNNSDKFVELFPPPPLLLIPPPPPPVLTDGSAHSYVWRLVSITCSALICGPNHHHRRRLLGLA